VRGAHRQVFPIEHLDDFSRQDGFKLFGIGVLMPRSRNALPLPRTTSRRSLSSQHLLQSLQTALYQLDFALRRLDSLRPISSGTRARPDFIGEIYRVDPRETHRL